MKFEFKNYLSNPFELINMYFQFGKMEKVTEEELEEYTFNKLKKLCIYCNQHVPYYRELFAANNIVPEEMKSIEDYKKIPILDKDIVRNNFEALQSDEIDTMNKVLCSTSGSTGTPLKIYLDSNVNRAIFCKLWRLWNQDPKWRIGKVLLTLDGDNIELRKKEWFFNFKNQFLYFTPSKIHKNNIKMYYNLVKKYKPVTMKGYPSAIYTFGKYLEEAGLELKFNTIFIHSENLLDFQKKFFESFFGARVVIQYGNNEKAGLIYSCSCNELHSQDDYAYHEVLDYEGNDVVGETQGRLVCTNLFNYSMPLLRYDTRDLAVFSNEKCKCGKQFKHVKEIVGRASDVIYTADGRVVSLIDSAFWSVDHIEMANVHQAKKGKIDVKIVPSEKYSVEDEQELMKGLRELCGDTMEITILHVTEADIPRTPAGKIRFILSDIK